jgi:ParB-like chromosome segregation protein Spo0J
VTHPDKFEQLVHDFRSTGWDLTRPNLLGYPLEGKIQLISGSHRWAAAEVAPIDIPVEVFSYEYIESIWGFDEWVELIKSHT